MPIDVGNKTITAQSAYTVQEADKNQVQIEIQFRDDSVVVFFYDKDDNYIKSTTLWRTELKIREEGKPKKKSK